MPRADAAGNAARGGGAGRTGPRYATLVREMENRLQLTARRRELALDGRGYRGWRLREEPLALAPERTALLLCDVWDHHWCRGAEERLELLLPQIDAAARAARGLGMLVVHAPSDTMPWYADHPARGAGAAGAAGSGARGTAAPGSAAAD